MTKERAHDGKPCARNQHVWSDMRRPYKRQRQGMGTCVSIALAAIICICTTLCASADGSCIVSGDTSRDAAVSASSVLVSPSWLDSSSFVEFITAPLSVFDSFPLGFRLIFR